MAFVRHETSVDHETAPSTRLFDGALLLVDVSLAGTIFVLPFLFGGQHAMGRLLLVSLALTAALAWAVRQCAKTRPGWRWSGVELLLIGGAALLVLQIVPLSQPLLQKLSPHTAEILPIWTAGEQLWAEEGPYSGHWSTISLTPAATRSALVIFLAYALLFTVTVQRIRATEDVERLLRWIALSALITAMFGLVQLFFSNGKFFWFYERPFIHTFKVPKAAFGNRNHFAHYLALGLGALIWWLQDSLRRRSKPSQDPLALASSGHDGALLTTTFRVLALGVVSFGVLLSLSRGGALAAALAVFVAGAVCYWAGALKLRVAAGLGAVALLIAASLGIFGHEQVTARLDQLVGASLDEIDEQGARRTVWKATLDAIPDYSAVGSGAGSFREVIPMYIESTDVDRYYSHAESGYLQIALETGIGGLGMVLLGIACCVFWCLAALRRAASTRTLTCVGAVGAGLAASVMHSAADFVWYNPACMTLVVILAACACRLYQLSKIPSRDGRSSALLPRPLVGLATLTLVVVGVWMVRDRLGPSLVEEHLTRFELLHQAALEPLRSHADVVPGGNSKPAEGISLRAEEKMKAELQKVVARSPNDARAHLDLAACYIRLFEHHQQHAVNVMSLSQIRDAAVQSQFASREALDAWLARAVGEHYRYLDEALTHTRRALGLCPLLGEGYLYLSDLCFLENGDRAKQSAYLAQALSVRPFDGTVLFHAGKEAWLAADEERWLDYWQRAFRCGSYYQRQMIDWLVGRAPPENLEGEIQFFLEVLQPDIEGLARLDQCYRQIAGPEQTVALRRAYAEALESEARELSASEAAKVWLTAAVLHVELAENDQAAACAREAIHENPSQFDARELLARCLVKERRYIEAEKQLTWCLKQRPGDAVLSDMYRQVVKARINSEIRTAAVEGSTGSFE